MTVASAFATVVVGRATIWLGVVDVGGPRVGALGVDETAPIECTVPQQKHHAFMRAVANEPTVTGRIHRPSEDKPDDGLVVL